MRTFVHFSATHYSAHHEFMVTGMQTLLLRLGALLVATALLQAPISARAQTTVGQDSQTKPLPSSLEELEAQAKAERAARTEAMDDLAARMHDFAVHYGTMDLAEALKVADALQKEAEKFPVNLRDDMLVDAALWLEWAKEDIEGKLRQEPSAADVSACYDALSARGYELNWNAFPLLYGDVSKQTNIGTYLCSFIRQDMLQSFQVSDSRNAWAVVGNVSLHFQIEKHLDTDDFFADPDSASPGTLWFALVEADGNGQSVELHNFDDSATLLLMILSKFGAPLAP